MKTLAATSLLLAVASSLAGCQSDQTNGGDQPGIVRPDKSNGTRPPPTTRAAAKAIADVEGVVVEEPQLVNLLYESNGLDALLKLGTRKKGHH